MEEEEQENGGTSGKTRSQFDERSCGRYFSWLFCLVQIIALSQPELPFVPKISLCSEDACTGYATPPGPSSSGRVGASSGAPIITTAFDPHRPRRWSPHGSTNRSHLRGLRVA